MKRCREDSFTGSVHVRLNQGGITEIRKEEKIEKEYEARKG